jgi:hypothetical protein
LSPTSTASPARRAGLAPLDDGFDDDDEQDLEALRPYVVNLTRGALSQDGIMQTSVADVDAIFDEHLPRFLAGRAEPVPVVFWAHGGIVSERAGLRIAGDQVPWWVRNGAYPIHFVWETGFTDTLRDLVSWWALRDLGGRGAPWQSVKRSAQVAAEPGGGAHYVAQRLARFCREHPGRITVHAAGHSAGAIFHSRFLPAADRLGVRSFGSLQLLAPALRVDEFESTLLPMIGTSIDRFAMYTLTAAVEQQDCCFRLYPKSLLYLVSEVFERPVDRLRARPRTAVRVRGGLVADRTARAGGTAQLGAQPRRVRQRRGHHEQRGQPGAGPGELRAVPVNDGLGQPGAGHADHGHPSQLDPLIGVVAHSTRPRWSVAAGSDGFEESGDMFRRMGRVGRPGLVGTVARTAVVAGTATATANAVSRHQANKAAEKQAAAEQQAAEQAPPPPAYQPPPPAYQPPPPPPAPEPAADSGGENDLVAQIGQLAKLRDAGVLSDAEFSAAKSKLLGL